mgnify:FL=1|tara:strand:- start:37 stop:651 length:615 start_codon:yes stop_codon:yes gene_type:complete
MAKAGRPSKGMVLSKHNIELAIKSTQSMGQAGLYMGVAKNTFKKYAKLHGLWDPKKSSAGIRKTGNVGSQLKHDLKAILEGKNPNPYREDTLLTKGIREGYIACKCDNCSADFTHIDSQDRLPPLILDFLDRNPMNTKLENLRVLCFNCVYELAPLKNGWYRHRDTAIGKALDEAIPGEPEQAIPKDDKLTYIPFEEFQKSLNN